MKPKQLVAIIVALALPLIYQLALNFYYSTIIGQTPLLQIPWVQEQVKTGGLGLDAIFCAVFTLVLIPIFIWIRRVDPQPRPISKVTPRTTIRAIVIMIGGGAIVTAVNMVTQLVLAADEDGTKSVQQFAETFATQPTLGAWFISFLSIAIFGPIVEELLFRGILYNGVRMIRGGWVPVAVTTIYFGLWHSSPVQIAYTMVIGLILGMIYYATNSLWLVMLLHIINNALSNLPPSLDNETVLLGLTIVKFIVLPFSIWLMWKMIKSARAQDAALSESGQTPPVR